MAIARRVDNLGVFTGSDLKFVFSLVGVDMSGRTGTFRVSTAPEGTALITAAVTVLSVVTENGVPTSILQAFASKTAVTAAKTTLAPADRGADITLYYEFRVSSLGGIGAAAEETLMYGSLILKGSI